MKVLLIHSFKGGSGKTMFSANLAKILSKSSRVLLIETDFAMPSFQSVFTKLNPDIFLNDFLSSGETDLTNYIYQYSEDNPNLDIIFCDEDYDPSHKVYGRDQNWFRAKQRQMNEAISNLNYDYIIFDTTPGVRLFVINLLFITDLVYLLLRTDTQSIRGTENMIEKIYKKTVDFGGEISLNIVINQIPKVPEIEEVIADLTQRFKYKYSFVKYVEKIEYEHKTSYLTSIDQFLLPDDNPTLEQIKSIIENTNIR